MAVLLVLAVVTAAAVASPIALERRSFPVVSDVFERMEPLLCSILLLLLLSAVLPLDDDSELSSLFDLRLSFVSNPPPLMLMLSSWCIFRPFETDRILLLLPTARLVDSAALLLVSLSPLDDRLSFPMGALPRDSDRPLLLIFFRGLFFLLEDLLELLILGLSLSFEGAMVEAVVLFPPRPLDIDRRCFLSPSAFFFDRTGDCGG